MNDGPSYLCPCGAEGYLTKSGRFLTWDEVEQLGDMMDKMATAIAASWDDIKEVGDVLDFVADTLDTRQGR
jgi:hypothetical protein